MKAVKNGWCAETVAKHQLTSISRFIHDLETGHVHSGRIPPYGHRGVSDVEELQTSRSSHPCVRKLQKAGRLSFHSKTATSAGLGNVETVIRLECSLRREKNSQ